MTEDVDSLVERVRDALTKGAHKGGHHPRCATGHDKGCDCYARASAPARAALTELAKRVKAAEVDGPLPDWKAKHRRCVKMRDEAMAQRDELVEALTKLRQWDMLNSYVGGDGERHEPTADAPYWRDFIDDALDKVQTEGDFLPIGHPTC